MSGSTGTMTHHEVILSGTGGQGLMFIGKVLANMAMDDYEHVTFFPSYGAEVRGGTSNCQGILSPTPIASPVTEHPTAMVLMNQPSVDRFLPQLPADGVALVNASLAEADGPNVLSIPASDIALELGDVRAANVVIFAAFLSQAPMIDRDKALAGIRAVSKSKGDRAVEINTRAFERGYAYLTAAAT